ncbi:MAG: tetratricopeptide repeat protein [Gemmataceae bacterium]
MSSDHVTQFERLTPDDIRSYDPQQLAAAANSLVSEYPEHTQLELAQRDDLLRLATVLERVESIHARHPAVLFVLALALGKAGEFERAIEAGRRNYDHHPGWLAGVSLANAYRRSGDLRPAIEMFRKSVEHDPTKYQSLLDVGDLSVLDGQIQQGLQAYEEVLSREPRQPWALASTYYCRYRLTNDQEWLDKLNDMAMSSEPEMEPGINRALKLLDEMGLELPIPDEHRDVWLATRILQRMDPDQDDVVDEIVAAGIADRKRAARLGQMIPIAWGRLLLESMGVSAPKSYLGWNPETGTSTERQFDNDPLYQEIQAVLPTACAQATQEQAQRMLLRSAEVSALNQALDQGADPRDLVLSQPMLISD